MKNINMHHRYFPRELDLIKDAQCRSMDRRNAGECLGIIEQHGREIHRAHACRLLVDYPQVATEVNARAVRLYDDLTAEEIQPENRDWSLDQMSRYRRRCETYP